MPTVTFTPNLRRHVPCPTHNVPGDTVREVLENAFELAPQLRSYILDEQGEVRHHIVLFLNGSAVLDRKRLAEPIAPQETLHVYQALSGG